MSDLDPGGPSSRFRPSTPRGRRSAAGSPPEGAKGGIGEPGVTHDGHFRCWTWNCDPLVLRTFVGQVRRAEVRRAGARDTCGRSCSRTLRTASAPATPARLSCEALLLRPRRHAARSTSHASASFAAAPLYVSTPIERTTRTAATSATGRREQPPLRLAGRRTAARAAAPGRSSECRSCRGSPTRAT